MPANISARPFTALPAGLWAPIWLCLAWLAPAQAEFDGARLTSRGAEHYAQKFTVGGRITAEADYILRSQPHPLTPSAHVLAGLDLTYAGARLGQSVSRLDDGYEYQARLEYNHLWSYWDIQLKLLTRIHIENRLKNFIEYALASGVRLGDNRLALHIIRAEDEDPHLALELLHEWNIRGVFYWQNLTGLEQGRFVGSAGASAQGERWFPYLQSALSMNFSREESWNPVFELGLYLYRNRQTEKTQARLYWSLALNF